MSDLSSLIARLEAAEGPDRLTDANILWAVDPTAFHLDAGDDQDHLKPNYCYARGGWTMNKADRLHLEMVGVPRFTSSLDAAVSLAERVLPDCYIDLKIGTRPEHNPRLVSVWSNDPESRISVFGPSSSHRVPAIALCVAILRALQQKGSSNG